MGKAPFGAGDFKSDLDSFYRVFTLSPTDKLDTLVEMWYYIFFWALFSSIFVHLIAAAFAFSSLRKHKITRFAPIFVITSGIITPFTVSLVKSAVIAGVYRAASLTMTPLYTLFYGAGQTIITLVFAYTRILATL